MTFTILLYLAHALVIPPLLIGFIRTGKARQISSAWDFAEVYGV